MITKRTHARGEALAGPRDRLSSDLGMALTTVAVMAVILFLLATALLMLATNLISATESQTAVTKATHMADAGLNAYLYELRRNPTFYVTAPTLSGALEDGVWTVTAEPPGSPGAPLVLRASGAIPSMETTNTVVAEVRFPTYAEYLFLTDADIDIGADAVIEGRIRSNGDITNKGVVTGHATAAGSITVLGSGVFQDGYEAFQPAVDFAQVTADLQAMKQVATDSGTYFASSGGSGFYAQMSGSQVIVYKVTGGTSTGVLSRTQIALATIPASGVLYFEEDVWVSGTYNAKVTIAGGRDIYIPDDLQPQNANSAATCGLVARRNIVVPSWYPNLPNNMTVTAALLAQTGSVYGDLHSGVTKAKITISGSIACAARPYFANSTSPPTAGFKTRTYSYDQRLEVEPPPMYPRLRDGSLGITTWFEE
jgi:hypothetical protein